MNVPFTIFRKLLFILSLIYLAIILVWTFFCFFSCAPACAQDKDPIGRTQGREVLVREIRLVGIKKISKGQIRQQMAGLWPPAFWKFWQEGQVFTPDKLEDSLNLVQQLYRQEGYYQTKISPLIDEIEGTVVITLHITEGPPVTIERIIFEIREAPEAQSGTPEAQSGAPAADEWETRFSQMIPLRKWAIFRVKDYEQSKTVILEYLANSGYPRAKLFGKVVIYQKENKAVIHLPIELGPFTRFGKIKVLGNKNISMPNIMREVTFAEGETFSMEKVFRTQSRINGLGFFRSVLVNPMDLQEGTGPADVQILVQERKRRTVEAGLGYGTEDKLRLKLSGTYRNIFGGSRELQLSFNFSDLAEEEALTFSQPYFPDPSSTSRWTLFRRKDKFTSFDVINTSSEFRVDRSLAPMLSAFLAYRLDSSRISGLTEIAEEDQQKVYFLSYFQTGLTWDTTDSPLDPTIGESATLFVEPSLQAIGSEVTYVKGTAEYKRYYHLVIGPVLAGRILMGTIQPFGLSQRGVPIMKQFFSGGTLSVRGYDYQKLGPYAESGELMGGNSLIEGSTELRIPLIGKLWGVLFWDFGNVSLDSMQFDFDKLRYSVGGGIRYKTIIGPLRLDIGYPLNPPKEVTTPYRIHLSIGQAF
jgi:outer membrane protein assembly complex protein YaeT